MRFSQVVQNRILVDHQMVLAQVGPSWAKAIRVSGPIQGCGDCGLPLYRGVGTVVSPYTGVSGPWFPTIQGCRDHGFPLYRGVGTVVSHYTGVSGPWSPPTQGCRDRGLSKGCLASSLPLYPPLHNNNLELEGFLELASNTDLYTGELELRIFWRTFNLNGRILGISIYLSIYLYLYLYLARASYQSIYLSILLSPASNMDPDTGEIDLRIY